MNPLQFFALEDCLKKIAKNHPKFCAFLKAVANKGAVEGAILECKIILPNGQEISSNLKLTREDIEIIENIKKKSPVR